MVIPWEYGAPPGGMGARRARRRRSGVGPERVRPRAVRGRGHARRDRRGRPERVRPRPLLTRGPRDGAAGRRVVRVPVRRRDDLAKGRGPAARGLGGGVRPRRRRRARDQGLRHRHLVPRADLAIARMQDSRAPATWRRSSTSTRRSRRGRCLALPRRRRARGALSRRGLLPAGARGDGLWRPGDPHGDGPHRRVRAGDRRMGAERLAGRAPGDVSLPELAGDGHVQEVDHAELVAALRQAARRRGRKRAGRAAAHAAANYTWTAVAKQARESWTRSCARRCLPHGLPTQRACERRPDAKLVLYAPTGATRRVGPRHSICGPSGSSTPTRSRLPCTAAVAIPTSSPKRSSSRSPRSDAILRRCLIYVVRAADRPQRHRRGRRRGARRPLRADRPELVRRALRVVTADADSIRGLRCHDRRPRTGELTAMSYSDVVSRVAQIQGQLASLGTAFDPSTAATATQTATSPARARPGRRSPRRCNRPRASERPGVVGTGVPCRLAPRAR